MATIIGSLAFAAVGLGVASALSPGPQANNTDYLSQNSNININQSCSAQTSQRLKNVAVAIKNADCENFEVGNQVASAALNCQQSSKAAVMAKAALMQDAQAIQGSLGTGSAKSNNAIDIQQLANENLQARCSSQYNQNISNEVFVVGNLKAKDCLIDNQLMNASASCMQSQEADISQSATAQQTAKSKVKGNMGFFFIMFMIIGLMMFGPELMLGLLPKPGKTAPDAGLPDLETKCASLKAEVVQKRGELAARLQGGVYM